MMKINSALSVMTLLLFTCPVVYADDAASGAAQGDEFRAALQQLRTGREDIIRDEIRFREEEAAAFWPAYAAYRQEVTAIRDRQGAAVASYLQAHREGAVTAEQAAQLVDLWFAIKVDLVTVQRKHLASFREILPEWKVARFYQLENKLDAELDVQLARFIPLMDPV